MSEGEKFFARKKESSQSEITLNIWDVDEDDQLVEFGEVEE